MNSESGTSGFSAVRSTTRNPANSSTVATPAPITHGLTQPSGGPCVNTSTAVVQASVASTAPVTSSRSRSRWVSRSWVCAIAMITMPIGTLIRNASRHEITVKAPPSTNPSTEPIPSIAADTAMAWLRACPTA